MMSLEMLAWWLPVIGAVALGLAGQFLRGATRRMTLAILPFALGCAMWWLGPLIPAQQSNWLAAFGKLIWYGMTYVAITFYYVVFLVSAIGLWLRHNAKQRAIESMPLVEPTEERGQQTAPAAAKAASKPATPAELGERMATAWKG